MTDVATIWSAPDGRGEWAVSGGDLASGLDLETAVLLSLFTDAAADPDDVIPDGTSDPRGWWGDAFEDAPIGSKLWLLDRSKKTEDVRQAAKNHIDDALAWLVTAGIAASVATTVQWQAGADPSQGFLAAAILITEPDGRVTPFNYQWAWGALASGSGAPQA
jgi:phage gp46-like protein